MASKLYIGGLAYSTTSEGLREFFTQCGNVLSATVITDRFSGQSRGFGFVEMNTAEEATASISQLNGRELDGRRITVALQEPGYPEREAVLRRLYDMNEAAFTRYFLHATFTGRIPNGPRQLATSAGLRRFVVNVPAAVGFIGMTDVDASVKTVSIDGQAAGAPGYSLTVSTNLKP